MSKVRASINFDFEQELERVLARADRLKAAIKGSASVKTVSVKAHNVRAHTVRAHERVIIVVPKK